MVIQSILDNDLYKFSMTYSYMKCFPDAEGEFEFKDRSENPSYTEEFLKKLNLELASLCSLRLKDEEFEWAVNAIPYIPRFYWEWLKGFRYEYDKIKVSLSPEGRLKINVTDKLYKVEFYEVPILAIVSELLGKAQPGPALIEPMKARLEEKIALSNQNQLWFSEFGTRRRYSYHVQEEVVKMLKEKATYCVGTSNLHLARLYGMKPTGTMAHSYIMFHAAMFGYRMANYMMMESWIQTYDGNLGIALTDTLTSQVFFDNFSRKHAKLFDGVRHDSGDPYKFINLTVKRYKELGIDPTTKTIIFSNALTMPDFSDLAASCKGRIRCSAGIGTNLTNDVGKTPANIVMKLKRCRMNPSKQWQDCIKISDDLGKHTGNEEEFELARKTLGL